MIFVLFNTQTMQIELCAASIEAIYLAKSLHFDRIELCQNLDQGGLTPSAGFIQLALDLGLETHVLIRPRAGGFVYSEAEIQVMEREIEFCSSLGVKGVVVGVLTADLRIDMEQLQRLKSSAKNMEVTFHRAFDDSFDWKNSIDVLLSCGIDRVLTSGMSSNIENGIPILEKIMTYVDSRIEIMVGGGVNLANAQKIISQVKPNAIHFSGTVKTLLDADSVFSETILQVDPTRIEKLRALCEQGK